MRPYGNGTTTPTSKRTSAANGKGRSTGKRKKSMQKTLLQAKVTAVKKTQKRMNNKRNKDEILDLLEKTANDSELNGSFTSISNGKSKPTKEDSATAKALVKAGKQIRKVRSIVAMNNGREKEQQQQRSKTENQNGKKVEEVMEVETAEEAVERPANGGGILQRTMSKIWKMPGVGITGTVPYENVESKDTVNTGKSEEEEKSGDGEKASCIIS